MKSWVGLASIRVELMEDHGNFSLSPNTLLDPTIWTTLPQAVDEVASQMEDPFELIPVDDIVSTYERDINRCGTLLCGTGPWGKSGGVEG